MTYKAIVAGMLERDSRNWMEKLLAESGIKFSFVTTEIEEMTQAKYEIYYTCKVTVYGTGNSILPDVILVGGTADEYRIYHSVVWDRKKDKILWMANDKTRNELGIEKFKIA